MDKDNKGKQETREAIMKKAVMPQKVNTISEAEAVVKKLIETKKVFTNAATNISAIISKRSIGKMGSEKATKKSVNPIVHAQTVANIDHLFENAPIHITHKDKRNDPNIKQIHRFGTVMEYEGTYYPVKITVKEFAVRNEASKIYSIEVVDIEETKKAVGAAPHPDEQGQDAQPTALNNELTNLLRLVKPDTLLSATSAKMSRPF
ncbi:MAG: hypothetical protein LBT00_12495 [Spirochaetaceae bacterium]|jgi:hypothetical protein|nr:hypothetical protein [Spirochaetaceae bacterium]